MDISKDIKLFYVDTTNIHELQNNMQLSQNAFLLCTAGNVTLKMDGKDFTLQKGDLYLYAAFSQTSVDNVSDDMRGIGGAANFEHVLKALECVSGSDRLTQIRINPLMSLTEEQFDRILHMVNTIRNRRNQPSIFSERIVMALSQVLLFELMDAYLSHAPAATESNGRADAVFFRFLAILSQNFRKEREVCFYASELRLTPRYFATIIRTRSGLSPGGWIARFVIAEAKTLLSHPDSSIKEVATQLNFPNQSFFGRYFKQHTGLTPGEYRKYNK